MVDAICMTVSGDGCPS